jgi:hypothetical protein
LGPAVRLMACFRWFGKRLPFNGGKRAAGFFLSQLA